MSTDQIKRADLHMHTVASDGLATAQDLLDFVATQRPELDVIAITDHDVLEASLWAYEQQHRYPFEVVPGVEVTSRDGHVLALWVTEPIKPHMSLRETVAAIHEAAGVAVLAHPIHPYLTEHLRQGIRHLMAPHVLQDAGLDALETHNAGMASTGFNWMARQLAHKINLAQTGSSDAHTLGAIGKGVTEFQGQSAEDLRRALLAKETIARGTTWSITDYVNYFKHERQRKVTTCSVTTNSSTLSSN